MSTSDFILLIYLCHCPLILKLISSWPGLWTLRCQRGIVARTASGTGLGQGLGNTAIPRQPGIQIRRDIGLGRAAWWRKETTWGSLRETQGSCPTCSQIAVAHNFWCASLVQRCHFLCAFLSNTVHLLAERCPPWFCWGGLEWQNLQNTKDLSCFQWTPLYPGVEESRDKDKTQGPGGHCRYRTWDSCWGPGLPQGGRPFPPISFQPSK